MLVGACFHDNGSKLAPTKIHRAFTKAVASAGITNFLFHDLRHSFCSNLRQRGVDLHTISKLAGHKDLRMTNRYAHLSDDTLRAAIRKSEDLCHVLDTVEEKEKELLAVTP